MMNISTFIIQCNKITDPLEQFEILTICSAIKNTFVFTNLTLILLFNLFLYFILCQIYLQKEYTTYHLLVDNSFKLIKNVVYENLSIKNHQYFTILFYLFFIIILSNLVGLIPYSFTVTSSFVVTFFLSCTHFIALNIIGITQLRWRLASLFLPSGVPLLILPFLILIEFVSYIARVFSLSIRLFANMMSGHALLKILIGFSWGLFISGNIIFVVMSAFPWVIVTIILFMEVLIAFLQAYVFVILLTVYINDILNMH